jgi:hypothetical protein
MVTRHFGNCSRTLLTIVTVRPDARSFLRIMSRKLLLALMFAPLLAFSATTSKVTFNSVSSDKRVIFSLDFGKAVTAPVESTSIEIVSPTGQRVPSANIITLPKKLRVVFYVNSVDFKVFEALLADSTGYSFTNSSPISLEDTVLEPGDLSQMTRDQFPTIDPVAWNKYIVGDYASEYLFPHLFSVGTRMGLSDSTKTVYFLDVAQSQGYTNSGDWHLFWGLKGRWSTDANDKLNYAQIYPLVLLHSDPLLNLDASMGLETGYQGFGRGGRGTIRGEVQYTLPFNPIDLRLGCSRWRLNPVIEISAQGNFGWADSVMSDSLKRSADVICSLQYDIPVGKAYYLQTNVTGDYATTLHQVVYTYAFSLGYIADGTIRIAAQYKQGYQCVSYQYDKQLLLGLAIDVLNTSSSK